MIINNVRRPDFHVLVEGIFEFIQKNVKLEDNQDLGFMVTDNEKELVLEISLYTGEKDLVINRNPKEWEMFDITKEFVSKEKVFKFDFYNEQVVFNKIGFIRKDVYVEVLERIIELCRDKDELVYTSAS